jgi:hypothetical protein
MITLSSIVFSPFNGRAFQCFGPFAEIARPSQLD